MLFVDKHAAHAPARLTTAAKKLMQDRIGEQHCSPSEAKAHPQMVQVRDPDVMWDRLDADTRGAVLDKLLREQGHLCAYCERSIGDGDMPAHVEHYVPRHPLRQDYPELTWLDSGARNASGEPVMRSPDADSLSVDYRNLLAVCSNDKTNDETPSMCDKSRGNMPLHIDPRSKQSLRHLSYRSSGVIDADSETITRDIGVDDTHRGALNLNNAHLRGMRRSAIVAEVKEINRRVGKTGGQHSRQDAIRSRIRQLLAMRDPKLPFYETRLAYLCTRQDVRGEFDAAYPA